MPAFDYLGRNVDEIVEFLITGKDSGQVDAGADLEATRTG